MKLIDDYILDDNLKVKQEFLATDETPHPEHEQIVAYLKAGAGYVTVDSTWVSEFNGQELPNQYLIDGMWMWGKWLIHYVEENHVKTA